VSERELTGQCYSNSGLPNVGYAERFPWHVRPLQLSPSTLFACSEIVYELPLLRNNTASETFLHKSGAVQNVDCIFIIGVTT